MAVARDGPEADALRDLLDRITGPKGAYAIGASASRMFLQEYTEQIAVATREQGLELLGLHDLPPAVSETLDAVREFLSVAVQA